MCQLLTLVFERNVPIYALKVTNKSISDDEGNLVLEVAQHLGDNVVRCIAMDATEV